MAPCKILTAHIPGNLPWEPICSAASCSPGVRRGGREENTCKSRSGVSRLRWRSPRTMRTSEGMMVHPDWLLKLPSTEGVMPLSKNVTCAVGPPHPMSCDAKKSRSVKRRSGCLIKSVLCVESVRRGAEPGARARESQVHCVVWHCIQTLRVRVWTQWGSFG